MRNNPDDDQARDNLRMAQLKLQQQQQNKGKDKNNDKKNKKEDKQEDKNNDKQEDRQQQQPQQQQQMSNDNMEQILQAMQNQEKATQEKVKLQQPQTVRKTGNQW